MRMQKIINVKIKIKQHTFGFINNIWRTRAPCLRYMSLYSTFNINTLKLILNINEY